MLVSKQASIDTMGRVSFSKFNNNLKYSRTIYAPGSNDIVDFESSKLALEKVLILMNEK